MTIFACVLLLCLIGTIVYFKRTSSKTDSDEKDLSAIQVQNSTRSRMPTPALIRNPINENEIYVDPVIRFFTMLSQTFSIEVENFSREPETQLITVQL